MSHSPNQFDSKRNINHPSLNKLSLTICSNKLLYTLWGIWLLFLTSQISIPLQPVPITLQTVGIMLIGLTFERRVAIQSLLLYFVLGAVGVPVFANFGAGFQRFFGPTAPLQGICWVGLLPLYL